MTSNLAPEKKSPFVERLPCKLTPAEKDLKADELAHAVNKRDALMLEKSLAAQRYAKEIKACERQIGDLAEEVRNGVEYRFIKVVERKDFERNDVLIIRTDTHEPCGRRAMRGDERQAEMFPRAAVEGDDPQLTLEDGESLGPDDDDDTDDDEIDAGESTELTEPH